MALSPAVPAEWSDLRLVAPATRAAATVAGVGRATEAIVTRYG